MENPSPEKDRKRRGTKGGPWRSVIAWALLVFGGLHLWGLSQIPPGFVDGTYRMKIYPMLVHHLGSWTGTVPFSISGALLLFGIILFLLRFLTLLSSIFSPGFPKRVLAALFRVAVIASILVHPFFLLWGYHYRGTPTEVRLALPRPSPEEVRQLVLEEAVRVTADYRKRGLDLDSGPLPSIATEVERSLRKLGLSTITLPPLVKSPPIPKMLLGFGTLGITSPFTLEVHAEPDLHWADLIFVRAHELAHLGGIPGEGAANFIAWHALTTCPHPLYRYAGWLGILTQRRLIGSEGASLGPKVKEDLKELFRLRKEGSIDLLAKSSRWIYNLFLKGQGIKAGVKDYDRLSQMAAGFLKKRR